jgi:hypothetical protein
VNNAVFWDVTSCESCKNRRFRGTYLLHHHGDKNWRARNVVFLRSVLRLLVTANDVPVPPQRQFLKKPHRVSSQKTAFFIVTVMKTSNLA